MARATPVLYTTSRTQYTQKFAISIEAHSTHLELSSLIIGDEQHHFTSRPNTMSSRVLSRREQNMARHFPGDPRFGVVVKPPASDLACLKKKEFLSTAVLDYVIRHTAFVPDSSPTEEPVPAFLGSLGAEAFISSKNLTASLQRDQMRTSLDWKTY